MKLYTPLSSVTAAPALASAAPLRSGRRARGMGWAALLLSALALLAGCSAGVGVGIPVGPFSIGVGVGSGGVSAGVGTGVGPLGVGVGVNQRGQVTGGAGVGVSTGVGGARVGAGVGTSTVLHDPARAVDGTAQPAATVPVAPAAPVQGSTPPEVQWRDAHGQPVPTCRVDGRC